MAALFEPSSDSFLYHQTSSLPHESSKDDTKSCPQAIDNGPAFMKRRHSSITKLGRFWTWLATDSWTLEYAALIVAMVSLASICIILEIYRDRLSSEWKHSVTLNTILSTLATVIKGALLLPVSACLSQSKWAWYYREKKPLQHFQIFDAASRGPMGAAWLLCQINSWHLASIGAIVTLIALALDAFVQQSVTYPLRSVNETASVPFSQSYPPTGMNQADYNYEVEQSMKAAIYDGVFYANTSVTGAAVSANCPTGNCTFPDYASMAVCSQCHDITSLITSVCIPANFGIKIPGNCTMQATLPNGLTMRNGIGEQITNSFHFNYLNMSTNSTLNKDDAMISRSLVNVTMLISNVKVAKVPDYELLYRNTMAFDCIFHFCVQKYAGEVSKGFFSEVITDKFIGYEPPYNEYWEPSVVTIPKGHILRDSNHTFSVDWQTKMAIGKYLAGLFSGVGKGRSVDDAQWFDSDVLEAIFLNGPARVPQTFANVATSMTNNIRLKSETLTFGTAIASDTYIHVRWVWLLLPLIMVVLTAVLLALTVWQSRRWDIPNWRSSALAVMAYGLQETEVSALRVRDVGLTGKEKISELERWTKGVHVSLRRRGHARQDYGLVPAES
jgi:Protein of unknown function (DUF3176)